MTKWTEEKIKAGFDAFLKEHDRLPTAHEVDASPLLPAARSIQKRFGGLVALRTKLGYEETSFATGENRSQIAHMTGERGRNLEIELEAWLQEHFGEHSVHTEKIFHGQMRVDFYVYTPEGIFGVDIFFADTIRTLQSSVNIKMKKYIHFKKPLFLVLANEAITQNELNEHLTRKRTPLPENVQLLTLENFKKLVQNYTSHERD